ncbi:MAG: hypothetical protein HOP15_06165 [Planctomycetes bacterium]|nr:hypothetical protein [Planctomycetota bacterium]
MPLSRTWVSLAMQADGSIRIPGYGARDHVIAGSVLEDGVPVALQGELAQFTSARCLRHFMNRDSEGLFADDDVGTELHFASAQEWGQWGGDALMENTFTWESALDLYRESALGNSFDDRREAFERTLVALGCNLHLLQDQFSPAHTRDDPHPGHALGFPYTVSGWAAEFFMSSSLLESEGPRFVNMLANEFELEIVPLIWAATHAEYFEKAVGWTANRFFSDDTIFEFFEHPTSAEVDHSDVDTCWDLITLTNDTYALSRSLDILGTKLAYRRYFAIPDPLGFDWSLHGSECDESEGLPSGLRNLSIVRANLRELIPEATGYSAALVDHFFRGRIDVSQDKNGDLVLTNSSASYGSGLNTLYGGDIMIAIEGVNLQRTTLLVHGLDGIVEAGETVRIPRGLLWSGTSLPAPVATLHIVYDGQIGEERGIAVTAFDYVDRDGICDQVCTPYALAPAGDVDGDGFADLVESFYVFPFLDLPWARVISPRGCREVLQIPTDLFAGQGIQAAFGAYGVGDANGDGRGDLLLLGQLAGLRASWIVSGASREILERIPDPWGRSIDSARPLGDLNGDGHDEFLAKLSTGGSLVASPFPFAFRFASDSDVEVIPDGTGDGRPDLRMGSGSNVYIVSGIDGTYFFLPRADDQAPYDYAYYQSTVPIRDVNGDGIADLFCTDPIDDVHPTIMLISGSDGASLWSRNEDAVIESGWVGDYDGRDGDEIFLSTFANGSWNYRLVHANDGGNAIAPVDTFTPGMLRTLTGIPIGDIDGDSAREYIYFPSDMQFGCWGIHFGGAEW